jgi:hypothetical protein
MKLFKIIALALLLHIPMAHANDHRSWLRVFAEFGITTSGIVAGTAAILKYEEYVAPRKETSPKEEWLAFLGRQPLDKGGLSLPHLVLAAVVVGKATEIATDAAESALDALNI